MRRHGQCNYTAGSQIFHPAGAQTEILVTQSFRVLPLTQILRMTHMELITVSPASLFFLLSASKNIQIHKAPDDAVYAAVCRAKFDYVHRLPSQLYNIQLVFLRGCVCRTVYHSRVLAVQRV